MNPSNICWIILDNNTKKLKKLVRNIKLNNSTINEHCVFSIEHYYVYYKVIGDLKQCLRVLNDNKLLINQKQKIISEKH